MAARDASFNLFIILAFRNRLGLIPNAHREDPFFKELGYNLDYSYIFERARRIFSQYSRRFPITKDMTPEQINQANIAFAQELINRIDGRNGTPKDKELLAYLDPKTAPDEPESFHKDIANHQILQQPPSAP